MEFNYDNNPNRGCGAPFRQLMTGTPSRQLMISAVIMLVLLALGSLIFTGSSALALLVGIFLPPICLVPWLVIALIVWGCEKLGES